MKAKSGNELSPPAKPKIWLKTNAHTPNVAKYESTTVPKSRTALRILRSSNPRIKVITNKIIGIIVRLSLPFAVLTSK